MKTFEEYVLKNLRLKNRIVLPPMDMYSADESGKANDFHYNHYTTRAIGGAGLIIVESTAVTTNGRISDNDLGIWSDEHIDKLSDIVNSVKKYGSAIAIQLNHGGRKYVGSSGEVLAPSAVAFDEKSKIPRELTKGDIKEIVLAFKAAAIRADKAGFDAIEIHGAHGYLIDEFLSPLSNVRTDEYGGSTENRTRFLKEILEAVSEVWPKEKTISLRVSAEDYKIGGITGEEMVKIINIVKPYIDIVHVSSGGLVPADIKAYPGYQIKLAELIKENCEIPTIAVGLITDINMVEEILSNERADLVALGRELLRNPYWVLNAAKTKGIDIDLPVQYKRAFQ
ncbi:MAG: NADPH dehydrogenase NamA [Clostridium sp.]|uniref:NADPH dehydrogenase NamA n=1 Tax=Clostridium sp. TaxID=1506 RepID=UPI0039E99886